jgi:acetate---CoA ligase (ADP-forming) subunit beta
VSPDSVRGLLEAWVRDGRRIVHEADTKRILALAGLAVPQADPADGRVVVKLASDRFPHKTEHGLVQINVAREDAATIGDAMRARVPDGAVLVEQMVEGVVAEWIVGCKHDATFGPIVLAGPGGTLVEVISEAEVRLSPTEPAVATDMLSGTIPNTLLRGVRGKPPADQAALADFIVRLSALFAEHADLIAEMEVNPVMVLANGKGIVAADALIVLAGHQEHKP